ncbi:hypothetical protein C8R47DRAFT_1242821 [Mycena vitilis]|nr:hypothetical protein C8R47DRAFT_1242821 [Mycena vitilis]
MPHLLLVPLPSWGHVRPICVLAGRIAAEGHLVTILMAPNLLEKAKLEVSSQFPGGHEALLRIRVASMFDSWETQIFQLIKPFAESYPVAYETLYLEKPIQCATTGVTFDAAPAPAAVILDFFGVPQLQATRALSGTSVPVIAWVTGGASTIIRLFGPESMGGLGNFGAKIDAEAQRTGKNPVEIFRHTEGTVINIPGLPPMHDYEFFPQKLPFESPVSPIVRGGYTFLMACDGVIISTAEAYEPVSLKALESWFTSISKPLYAVGPLLPPSFGSRLHANDGETEVKAFLDRMLGRYGAHSLLFISFGTVFWPTVSEYVDEVVEALLEKKAPFPADLLSCFAVRPYLRRVGAQSRKLRDRDAHDMVAATIHTEPSRIMESLSSGVPLICWPFDADQPAAAKHLTQNLDVAFELIEVRTGLGLKPLYGSDKAPRGTREAVGIEIREIIDQARGDVGEEKRNNVERLRQELNEAWNDDGAAKCALKAFLKSYS